MPKQRVSLIPHLDKIYEWWKAGETDQQIAARLGTVKYSITSLRQRHGMADGFRTRADDYELTECTWVRLMRGRLFDIRATSDNGPAHLPRIDPANGMGASSMAYMSGGETGHKSQARGHAPV